MVAMAAIFDFRSEWFSEWFELFFIYKSPKYFLLNFELIGLSVQVKKFKIYFKMAAMAVPWISDHNDFR